MAKAVLDRFVFKFALNASTGLYSRNKDTKKLGIKLREFIRRQRPGLIESRAEYGLLNCES